MVVLERLAEGSPLTYRAPHPLCDCCAAIEFGMPVYGGSHLSASSLFGRYTMYKSLHYYVVHGGDSRRDSTGRKDDHHTQHSLRFVLRCSSYTQTNPITLHITIRSKLVRRLPSLSLSVVGWSALLALIICS